MSAVMDVRVDTSRYYNEAAKPAIKASDTLSKCIRSRNASKVNCQPFKINRTASSREKSKPKRLKNRDWNFFKEQAMERHLSLDGKILEKT